MRNVHEKLGGYVRGKMQLLITKLTEFSTKMPYGVQIELNNTALRVIFFLYISYNVLFKREIKKRYVDVIS